VLDQKLVDIAQCFHTPLHLVRRLPPAAQEKPTSTAYWQRWNQLHHQLSGKFHLVLAAVRQCNKRPRQFISRESQLSSPQLLLSASSTRSPVPELLKFFLNHRIFMRSECSERVGKSPTELMTGQPHAHWLELLVSSGFNV